MKKKWAIATLIVMSITVIGVILNSRQGAFAVLSSNFGVVAVPADKLRADPILDFSLFGTDVQIPKKRHFPLHSVGKATSGALVFEVEKSRSVPGPFEWLSGDFSWQAPMVENYSSTFFVFAPKVFGSSTREIELTSSNRDRATIRLAPLGIPAPLIASQEFEAGGARIRVKPIEWMSPSFPVFCELTLLSGKSVLFLLSMFGNDGVILERGKTARICLPRFQNHKTLFIGGRLTPVRRGKITLRFRSNKTTPGLVEDQFFYPDGSLFVEYSTTPDIVTVKGPMMRNQALVELQDLTWPYNFGPSYPKRYRDTHSLEIMKTLEELPGKSVEAIEYYATGPAERINFDLGPCPNADDFGVVMNR